LHQFFEEVKINNVNDDLKEMINFIQSNNISPLFYSDLLKKYEKLLKDIEKSYKDIRKAMDSQLLF